MFNLSRIPASGLVASCAGALELTEESLESELLATAVSGAGFCGGVSKLFASSWPIGVLAQACNSKASNETHMPSKPAGKRFELTVGISYHPA
jgi:hypothetical protein